MNLLNLWPSGPHALYVAVAVGGTLLALWLEDGALRRRRRRVLAELANPAAEVPLEEALAWPHPEEPLA